MDSPRRYADSSDALPTARRKAETYPPETHVIDLAELRQIVREMQPEREKEAS